MGDSSLRQLVKSLRQQYPYTPPGELYPSGSQFEFLWNVAIREGREQVIRHVAELSGEPSTSVAPEERLDVFSPEDRSAADAAARASSNGGTASHGKEGEAW